MGKLDPWFTAVTIVPDSFRLYTNFLGELVYGSPREMTGWSATKCDKRLVRREAGEARKPFEPGTRGGGRRASKSSSPHPGAVPRPCAAHEERVACTPGDSGRQVR